LELKSLFVGLVFALGTFGIKSGAGLSYFLYAYRDRSIRWLFLLLYAAVYFIIFEASFYTIGKIDLLEHLLGLQGIFKHAMILHLIIAGGLLMWGITLLRRESKGIHGTYAWLAMVIPCPVCISVIFITTAFILSYFPQQAHRAVIGAYLVFIVLVFITIMAISLWPVKKPIYRNRRLALTMIMVASYFVLSVIIMPQFQDLDKVYRLARYRGDNAGLDLKRWIFAGAIIAVPFWVGFFRARRRLRGII